METKLTLKLLNEKIEGDIERGKDLGQRADEMRTKMIDCFNKILLIKGRLYEMEYNILNDRTIIECKTCGAKITRDTAKGVWKFIGIQQQARTFDISSVKQYSSVGRICPKCEAEGSIEIYKMLFEKEEKKEEN